MVRLFTVPQQLMSKLVLASGIAQVTVVFFFLKHLFISILLALKEQIFMKYICILGTIVLLVIF